MNTADWPAAYQERHRWFCQAADRACTPKQLVVLKARARNLSHQQIALALNLDRATIRGHEQAALRRIQKELAA